MAFKDDVARKAYFREYNKSWYQRHRERLLEKRRQHNEELRQWLRRYKSKLRWIEWRRDGLPYLTNSRY